MILSYHLAVALALFVVGARADADGHLLDLSLPYVKADNFPTALGQEMVDIAEAEPDISAFVALECGKVVAEYGDQSKVRHLFSATKSWTGLLFGIMEKDGLFSLDETLEDIWPDEAVWEGVAEMYNVTGAELRKKTTLEELLQMRGGYVMPDGFMKDVLIDALPFNNNRLGGGTFEDSLTYHPQVPEMLGKYNYVMAGNLMSYIIKEKTGMTSEEYATEKVFPLLGITEDDYEWYDTLDGANTAFHGLKMNVIALSKLAMLYHQGGMANEVDQVVDPSWIERSFTLGDADVAPGDKFGYIAWWLEPGNSVCTYGFGGQRACINPDTNRVFAILSDTYYKDAGIDAYEDPTASFPTDQVKEKFILSEPTEPIECMAMDEENPPTGAEPGMPQVSSDSSSGNRLVPTALFMGLAYCIISTVI